MRSKIIVTALSLVGGLLAAIPAAAGPPLIIRTAADFNFPMIECDGFDIWTSGIEIDTEKYWFNEAGEAVRLMFSVHTAESEYYNSDHPEISVSQGQKGAGENSTFDIDLTTGDQHGSGGAFRITIPGIGRVLWVTGTMFYDASEDTYVRHGADYVLPLDDTGPALCAALAYTP